MSGIYDRSAMIQLGRFSAAALHEPTIPQVLQLPLLSPVSSHSASLFEFVWNIGVKLSRPNKAAMITIVSITSMF